MKILIFGDLCPTADQRALWDEASPKLFGDVQDLIKQADFVLGNLECPATDATKPAYKTGPNLKAETKDIAFLKNVGFDAFSLANNHILDYGETGVLDTLAQIKKASLSYFGAGENQAEAETYCTRCFGDTTISFLSFAEHEFNRASQHTAGANVLDPYVSLSHISQAQKQSDYVVVLYHGGIEHYPYPTPLLQKKCRAMVDAGANLVLCQHSHCIGTQETYHDGTILYGQGNTLFGYRPKSKEWNEGLVVELNVEKSVSVSLHLLCTNQEGIHLNHDKERMNTFLKESSKITDPAFVQTSFSHFCQQRVAHDLPLFYGKSIHLIRLNRLCKGRLFRPSRWTKMVTHNTIRCDALNEVIQEILAQNEAT